MTESVNSRMHATFERQFQMEAKDCTVCAHCYGRESHHSSSLNNKYLHKTQISQMLE